MSEEVRRMFASISDSYDTTNSVLSFGIHHYWRHVTVKMSGAAKGQSVLDCATGTGDLAIAFKRAVGPEGHVIGTDFCEEMMETAPAKAKSRNLEIDFEVADAMNLPYEDNKFDISSIAFGIRNVDDPVKALKEMARVVKPGGRVMVLEFGQPKGVMKVPFRLYSQTVMPFVGGLISGNKDAYTYLPETSAVFPAADKFITLMVESEAFSKQKFHSLTGGIAYAYLGVVK